ncbi:MAG: hypothetical protein ACI80K_003489 [Paracoccaceae bacterium]
MHGDARNRTAIIRPAVAEEALVERRHLLHGLAGPDQHLVAGVGDRHVVRARELRCLLPVAVLGVVLGDPLVRHVLEEVLGLRVRRETRVRRRGDALDGFRRLQSVGIQGLNLLPDANGAVGSVSLFIGLRDRREPAREVVLELEQLRGHRVEGHERLPLALDRPLVRALGTQEPELLMTAVDLKIPVLAPGGRACAHVPCRGVAPVTLQRTNRGSIRLDPALSADEVLGRTECVAETRRRVLGAWGGRRRRPCQGASKEKRNDQGTNREGHGNQTSQERAAPLSPRFGERDG